MPDMDDTLEWLEDAEDWLGLFSSEITLGLLIALGLMFWIWKGRQPAPHRPA